MGLFRATLPINLTYTATLLAPWLSLLSFRLAKRRRYAAHRAIQLALLGLCWATVLGFEVSLRIAGGSGAFLLAANPSYRTWARALLLVHVTAAVVTYAAWSWLAFVSQRRFRQALPGAFSSFHRTCGRWVWGGLWFTAASATGMYLLTFML